MVRAEDVSFKVGGKVLLQPTSIDFDEGKFHVVMGANGAGKSTLLKIIAGEQPPTSGDVFLAGKALAQYTKKELALKRAVLSQHYHLAFPIAVNEVVMMGRYPFFDAKPSGTDDAICRKAMAMMDVEKLAERDYTTLSGGEAQKVQMCRVLAQIWNEPQGEKKLLLLDEPVSHLDVKYQYQLLRIAKEFCRQAITVIAILHDINLAISFADRILFLKEGEVLHRVDDATQINSKIIEDTFGVPALILQDNTVHKPVVIF